MNEKGDKEAHGISKTVVKNMAQEEYKNSLFENKQMRQEMKKKTK